MVGLGRDSPYGIFYLKTINGNIIRKILENQNLRTLRVLFEVLISIEVIYNPQVSIRSNKLAGVGRAFKAHRNLEGYILLQWISALQTKPSRFNMVNIRNKI